MHEDEAKRDDDRHAWGCGDEKGDEGRHWSRRSSYIQFVTCTLESRTGLDAQ